MTEIFRYIEENKELFLNGLKDFLAIPSISAQNRGMESCARWLSGQMEELGITTSILPTPGYPVVYGELIQDPAAKTLLVYGHYDVQPPEPIELWETDPFEPVIKGQHLYARGATDDKGNIWAVLMGVKTAIAAGSLNVNLKFLFEGEEEIGSPNLSLFVEREAKRLHADFGILCDRGIHESGRPQMFLGNKGVMKLEIRVKEGKRDVHSGHAPLIPNAAWELVRILNTFKDENERILVDDYYSSIREPSEEDRDLIARIPFDPDGFRREYGLDKTLFDGTPEEMVTHLLFSPTMNISGIASGYYGEGSKTIVPNRAVAKIDFRLVDGMTSKEARDKVTRHLEGLGRPGMSYSFLGSTEPSKVSPGAPPVRAAIESASDAYGAEPVVWPLLDGSGPLALFNRVLEVPMFIAGLGAPFSTANTHAPNENIGLKEFYEGVAFMADYYHRLGKITD